LQLHKFGCHPGGSGCHASRSTLISPLFSAQQGRVSLDGVQAPSIVTVWQLTLLGTTAMTLI